MSQFTAIKRTNPSAPMRFLHENKLLVGRTLDYGCGRGFDAKFYSLEAYDPYWRAELPQGKFDTITCIYVLNVVDKETSASIIEKVRLLLAPGGKAYFVVRRDLRESKKGRGCIQRSVNLSSVSIRKTSSYEIYEYAALV